MRSKRNSQKVKRVAYALHICLRFEMSGHALCPALNLKCTDVQFVLPARHK